MVAHQKKMLLYQTKQRVLVQTLTPNHFLVINNKQMFTKKIKRKSELNCLPLNCVLCNIQKTFPKQRVNPITNLGGSVEMN